MSRAAPNWPSESTRALIAGKYDVLFEQSRKIFGAARSYRLILRAVLGRADEVDADAFEEPHRV